MNAFFLLYSLNELRHSLQQQQNNGGVGDNVLNAFKRLEANIQVSFWLEILKASLKLAVPFDSFLRRLLASASVKFHSPAPSS